MDSNNQHGTEDNSSTFFSLIRHLIKFRLYLLKNLPAGYFSGLKIVSADQHAVTVSIPYKWLTRNPFRSTYFASLSMAAELSTGVLAMAAVYKKKPAVSLIVTAIEGKFYKKSIGLTFFHCADGEKMKVGVSTALSTGLPQVVKAHSIGKNKEGEVVAEFWISWSFKSK